VNKLSFAILFTLVVYGISHLIEILKVEIIEVTSTGSIVFNEHFFLILSFIGVFAIGYYTAYRMEQVKDGTC
jgi:hypothetical protein